MANTISVDTGQPEAIRDAIAGSGWLDGEQVIAAGQLRQGKAPSMLSMVLGYGLWEVIRPRRSKQLPRHFVLAVTDRRVVAFKASGGREGDGGGPYVMRVRPGREGEWERAGMQLTQLDDGAKSKGGVLLVGGERVPVARPNLNGDPSTDELFATLSG